MFRYSVADEKLSSYIGSYDYLNDSSYSWPAITTGSVVDLDYVKLYMDNAKLKYYENNSGVGGTVVPVSGYPNRIKANGIAFASNGTDYPKSAAFKDRGAKIGDAVYVRGVASGTTYELNTKIASFIGDDVSAVTAAASAATTNKSSQSASATIDDLGTVKNTITVTANASAYDGREDGAIDEYYTIEVIQSSRDGDLTSGRLRVTTSSGLDNVSSVVPAGAGGQARHRLGPRSGAGLPGPLPPPDVPVPLDPVRTGDRGLRPRRADRRGDRAGRRRDRRGIADRHMPHVADQIGDHACQQFLVAKIHLIPPLKREG